MNNINELYNLWLEKSQCVPEVYNELKAMKGKKMKFLTVSTEILSSAQADFAELSVQAPTE